MSDFHVHHVVQLMAAPGADVSVVREVLFKSVAVTETTETQEMENPDGSHMFVYTDAYIQPEDAKRLAAEYPDYPIILVANGHDSEGHSEQMAIVFHGENGQLSVNTVEQGPIDKIIDAASREDGLFL